MKISVAIPAYNAAATIDATLESVFAQTASPDEILVVDDGSKDDTLKHLEVHQNRIKIIRQTNSGAACARNRLSAEARGDVVAFLDADDLWHPRYLAAQREALEKHPQAVASFTGHVNFRGTGEFSWPESARRKDHELEVIDPLAFLARYNECPGPFGSMSFCCIPKKVLAAFGNEPFPVKATGAEDFCLMNALPLHGPVLFTAAELVAYRETPGSLSSNRLKVVGVAVKAFELLEANYAEPAARTYAKVFNEAHASKRRLYAKYLMGQGRASEARSQLKSSLAKAGIAASRVKSLALLASTYLPVKLQPRWPAAERG